MVSDLFFSELLLFGLLWLCVMLHYGWRGDCSAGPQRAFKPATSPRKRSRAPKLFPGLTYKPPCATCEQTAQQPAAPPPPAPVRSKYSCGLAVVVAEQPTEPLSTLDR
jgi:hypothetical protein